MKVCEAFTKRLDFYLVERNISLYKLAKDACVPLSTLQNFYRKHSNSPTLSLLYKITTALNITVAEFLDCEYFSPELLEFY